LAELQGIDADRKQSCGCPRNCCSSLPWGEAAFRYELKVASSITFSMSSAAQAEIRNYLYGLSQREESDWRRQYLQHLLVEKKRGNQTDVAIAFQGKQFCLKGFSIFVGGSNYLRTCYRDLAEMMEGKNHDGLCKSDRQRLSSALHPQSHRRLSLTSYLEELVTQLAEQCPVTGKLIITVSLQYITATFPNLMFGAVCRA
jgi:hypothetical protein